MLFITLNGNEIHMSNLSLAEKILRFPAYSMTRVTGWYVPKSAMNPGKTQEHADRVNFDYKVSINHNDTNQEN